jgi:hypothetical protein
MIGKIQEEILGKFDNVLEVRVRVTPNVSPSEDTAPNGSLRKTPESRSKPAAS